MFNPINSDSALAKELSISRVQAEAEAQKSDKNQFLDLLVAQMENQNPLEPQQGAEFLSQLAQFSTVDGIERLNESMADLSSGFRSGQALQATALVGRKVDVDSSIAALEETGTVVGSVVLDKPMVGVKVQVKDMAGQPVRLINLGTLARGTASVTWDGLNDAGNRLPPGEYRIEATGMADGATEQLKTRVGINVDSVTLGQQGEVTLNLRNGTSVGLSEVNQIN